MTHFVINCMNENMRACGLDGDSQIEVDLRGGQVELLTHEDALLLTKDQAIELRDALQSCVVEMQE